MSIRIIKHKSNIIIAAASSIFLLGGIYFLHPFTIESSYAESDDFDATVNVASNLSISATDVTITDTPEASGSWLTGTSNVVVSTNNTTGYKLYISSADDQVDLINTDNSKYKISNLSSETTENNFKNSADLMNYYGFTTNNNGSDTDLGQITTGTYLPLTDNNNARLINATTEKKNISQTDVTFATKVDRSIPAGEYTNTITFTAIANPVVTTVYMQDMDAAACQALDDFSTSNVEGTTYEVVDKRDKAPYYIRKFNFGGTKYCTMVENLNLAGGTTVTYEDTNIQSNTTTYLPPSSSTTATGTYTLPESSNTDFNSATQKMFNGYGRNRDGATYTNSSSSYGTVGTFAVDGAYYNWQVATAGTGGPYGTSRASTGDICPKNWRLFTSSEYSNIVSTINSLGINNWYTATGSATTPGTGAATSSPIYSGYMHNNSVLLFAGSYGFWWSSTQSYGNDAHDIYANSGSLYTYNYRDKCVGFSVRCLLPAT